MGLGAIPSDHYLSLDMLGMHGTVYANYAVQRGRPAAGLRRPIRRPRHRQAQRVRQARRGSSTSTSTPPRSTRTSRPHIPVHANVKDYLKAINPLVSPGDWRRWHQQIDEWRASDPMAYDQRDDLIMPQYVIDQFSTLTQGDSS